MSSLRIATVALTVSAGLIAAGCGGSASSLSPTGPSATSGIALGARSTASDAGTFGTEKKGSERDAGDRGRGSEERGREERGRGDKDVARGVKVNGRITAIDLAAHTFTVGTSTVNVPGTAIIRHGNRVFEFADLAIGDHVEVKGAANATGVLVASEIKVEQGGRGKDNDRDDDEDDDQDEAEVEGAVSALTGTCPALTFNVLTTKVTTTATTRFRDVTCAALANGTLVEVEGTRQPDGSIVARRVSLED